MRAEKVQPLFPSRNEREQDLVPDCFLRRRTASDRSCNGNGRRADNTDGGDCVLCHTGRRVSDLGLARPESENDPPLKRLPRAAQGPFWGFYYVSFLNIGVTTPLHKWVARKGTKKMRLLSMTTAALLAGCTLVSAQATNTSPTSGDAMSLGNSDMRDVRSDRRRAMQERQRPMTRQGWDSNAQAGWNTGWNGNSGFNQNTTTYRQW